MSGPIFFDTETCGFHGPAVLIQWAEGDGEIHLHSVFKEPVWATLELIQKFCNHPEGIVGFNLGFDWFHICQTYTTLLHLDRNSYPEDCIEAYALAEPIARDGPCLKPVKAHDLMLHARKGPYQSTMERDDIKIRRVPTVLANALAQELELRVQLKDIYFAKRKDKHAPKWKIRDLPNTNDFKNVVLHFAPSSALKALATDALALDPHETMIFADIELDDKYRPEELGYAPFALAVGTPENWNGAWPEKIEEHIIHWSYNSMAREYATKDVVYTRGLYYHFGRPALGDDDSELACQVAASRWKGFAQNTKGLRYLRKLAVKKRGRTPIAPRDAMHYITFEEVDEAIKLALTDEHGIPSTKKVLLEVLSKMVDDDGKLIQAALKAKEVLQARKAEYERDFYDKCITAGRLHAYITIIGTKSSRGSGGAKNDEQKKAKKSASINSQGIKKTKKVRAQFPLAFTAEGEILSGGDFSAFEVTIADGYYGDPQMHKDLITIDPATGSPRKIHAIAGTEFYPGMTYEEICASDGSSVFDFYTRSKSGLFGLIYFGNEMTLANKLGIDTEAGKIAMINLLRRWIKMAEKRQEFANKFCTMKQAGGIGTRIIWNDPADFVESMLGFKRYFTLENQLTKVLYELAENPPKAWRTMRMTVQRRREGNAQTAFGAVQSAIFGAAFQIQAANMRAAGNHVIQSTGAQLTKGLQRRIWDVQPSGIHEWHVRPMNSHDELMVPMKPELAERVEQIVKGFVAENRVLIPLLDVEWHKNIPNWSAKGKKKRKPVNAKAA